MVRSCSARGCVNRQIPGTKKRFHAFPLKNKTRNQLWVQAVARKGFIPNTYSSLCSDHFAPNCFYSQPGGNISLRLKDDAIPTIFSFSLANKQPPKACKLDFGTTVCSVDENSKVPLLSIPLTELSLSGTSKREKYIQADENSELPLLSTQLKIELLSDIIEEISNSENSENSEVPLLCTPSKSKKPCYTIPSRKRKMSPSKYELKDKITRLQRENKTLRQQVTRQRNRISCFKDELEELKDIVNKLL